MHHEYSMFFSCDTVQYPFAQSAAKQCFTLQFQLEIEMEWNAMLLGRRETGVPRTSMKNNDNVNKLCIFFLNILFGYKCSNSEGLLQSSAMLLAPSGKSFLNLVKEKKIKENKPARFNAFQCVSLLCATLPSPSRCYVLVRSSHTFDLLISSYICS